MLCLPGFPKALQFEKSSVCLGAEWPVEEIGLVGEKCDFPFIARLTKFHRRRSILKGFLNFAAGTDYEMRSAIIVDFKVFGFLPDWKTAPNQPRTTAQPAEFKRTKYFEIRKFFIKLYKIPLVRIVFRCKNSRDKRYHPSKK